MSGAGEPPRSPAHPLEGVLDRLLARERGAALPEAPRPEPQSAPRLARRMLVIAALGEDEGRAALRAAGRWGLRGGRHPAVLELACGGTGPECGAGFGPPAPGSPRLPLACVPCGPERLRLEPPETIRELLERLRRHESASDLLLVRIPPRARSLLMRAALLAGGLILPLDGSGNVLSEAFRLSREILEYFVDLRVWPCSGRRDAVESYQVMMSDFLGHKPRAIDDELARGAAFLDGLPGASGEGFLPELLACDEPAPPVRLLQTGFLQL